MANGDRTIPGTMPASPGPRPCCMLQPDPIPSPFGSIEAIYDLTAKLDHRYDIGKLGYARGQELSGLLYTCSLGFVDLGHSRETTDFTWFYFNWIRRRQKNKAGDTFQVLADFGGTVTIKKDIPRNDHIQVARSIAYDQALFHEIVSYWNPGAGAHTSSFSPEDLVSNFVGTYIAERAIKALAAGNFGGDFDKAATAELIILLMRVQALPKNKVIEAFDQIKGRWVVGNAFRDPRYLRRRNFNVAPIVPWLVLVNEPACEPLTLPPDFDKDFPPTTKTFYEIDFNVHPDLQSIMGGTALKTSEFDREITKIKAHASQPEDAGGYGSAFDQP
jgi:Protein of unknown function (DUF4056)